MECTVKKEIIINPHFLIYQNLKKKKSWESSVPQIKLIKIYSLSVHIKTSHSFLATTFH